MPTCCCSTASLKADWDFTSTTSTALSRHAPPDRARPSPDRFLRRHAASSSCHQRRAGFQQALAEAGLSLPPGWMIESAPNRLEAAARTDELFADGHRPSAAVCYNDTVALGLMLGLNSRGIRPAAILPLPVSMIFPRLRWRCRH